METDDFFVMLSHPVCQPLIMTTSDGDGDDIAYFSTRELAVQAARNNDLGDSFGYEVFRLGCGE
tara:strand:+ start:1756 stop:1947 length:192 start_codon:yes stop_codon:yes gene_type:complete